MYGVYENNSLVGPFFQYVQSLLCSHDVLIVIRPNFYLILTDLLLTSDGTF